MEEYPYRYYRALHRGNEGDLDFYRSVASEARRILELGAGDGRIARAIAEDGKEIVALERSEEAIALGKQERGGAKVQWAQGEMERFSFDERFDRIIAPYTALYCLLTPAALRDCLGCVHDHLERDGLFVFDIWPADDFHNEGEGMPPEELEAIEEAGEVARVKVDGAEHRVFESSRWHRAAQLLDVHYRYEPVDGGEAIFGAIPQRYLLLDEIAQELEAAGLQVLVLHGDFDQRAYDEESERLIVTAARADSAYFAD